jgi:hypothetical protein
MKRNWLLELMFLQDECCPWKSNQKENDFIVSIESSYYFGLIVKKENKDGEPKVRRFLEETYESIIFLWLLDHQH